MPLRVLRGSQFNTPKNRPKVQHLSIEHPLFRVFTIADCNGFRISIGTVGDHLADQLGPGVAERVEAVERHRGGSRAWAARGTTHTRAKYAWSTQRYKGTTEEDTLRKNANGRKLGIRTRGG